MIGHSVVVKRKRVVCCGTAEAAVCALDVRNGTMEPAKVHADVTPELGYECLSQSCECRALWGHGARPQEQLTISRVLIRLS